MILIQIGNKRTMRRGLRRLAVNHKYWPNERWAEVLRHLRQRHPGSRIVLLGTGPEYAAQPGSRWRWRMSAGCTTSPMICPFRGWWRCWRAPPALISVDSGPAHAAAAVGCPQVVLFGKALPSLYRPWGTAAADVKLLCGEVDGEPDMLGIACEQRDRGMVAI